GHDWQRPPVAFHVSLAALYLPLDNGIAHHADAVSIGDHHWTIEEAGILDPMRASHLAVPVQAEPAGENGISGVLAAGQNRRHPRPHRADAYLQRARPGDQSRVADFDAFNIRACNQRARIAVVPPPEI